MKLAKKILSFTTGLGFYGLGLLLAAAFFLAIGWHYVASGLLGAFIHKNYKAIVNHFENIA